MRKPILSDYLTSPELQAFTGQISLKELTNYTTDLELYCEQLEAEKEKDAIEFSEWKDKEFPCKMFDKYAKERFAPYNSIQELYKQFKASKI